MRRRDVFAKRGLLAMRADMWGLAFEVETERPSYDLVGNAAIVTIDGPLTHHREWWWDSYDEIKERVQAALASPASTVVLRINSPGGEVSGCFETARELREIASLAGKQLVAYADGLAASAGYALACAASRIYLSETSFVGSIGVMTTLFDAVGMNEQLGLRYEVIASGKRKRDGNPNVPISEAAIAAAQKQVDDLAAIFFGLVSETRGLDVEAIAALEAGILLGRQAVSAGLADGVMTFDALLESLSSSSNEASPGAENEGNMTWKDALKKAAEDGDEEAKKALRALEDEEEKKDDEPSAEDSEEEKDAEEEEKREEARAHVAVDAKAIERIVDAKIAAVAEATERDRLLAARKDLPEQFLATLKDKPLSFVREALAALPVAPRRNPAADLTPKATRGDGQGSGMIMTPEDQRIADEMDRAMGLKANGYRAPYRREDGAFVHPINRPSDVRAHRSAHAENKEA